MFRLKCFLSRDNSLYVRLKSILWKSLTSWLERTLLTLFQIELLSWEHIGITYVSVC